MKVEQTNFSVKKSNQIGNYLAFPKNLEYGDLLFYDLKSFISVFAPSIDGFSDDHVVIYIGRDEMNKPIFLESIDYTFFDINFSINGVQKTKWNKIFLLADKETITLGKVHADEKQKNQAIEFISNRIGEHYQWGFPDDWRYESWHCNPEITDTNNPFYDKYFLSEDIYSNQWICAELIWAAFINQGIELNSNPIPHSDPGCNNQSFYYVGPKHIRDSENVTICTPEWW